MELKKDYENLINDLREDADEVLRADNINYYKFNIVTVTDIYRNYKGVFFTLECNNIFYHISTLPQRSFISAKKLNRKTGFEMREEYPMPDDIKEIIYNFGKHLTY